MTMRLAAEIEGVAHLLILSLTPITHSLTLNLTSSSLNLAHIQLAVNVDQFFNEDERLLVI